MYEELASFTTSMHTRNTSTCTYEEVDSSYQPVYILFGFQLGIPLTLVKGVPQESRLNYFTSVPLNV